MWPDGPATVGCDEDIVGEGNRTGWPPSRLMLHNELSPLAAEPANSTSRPPAVQSRVLMSHAPVVICLAVPPALPSRFSGITRTLELNALVRRTNARALLSGEMEGDKSLPAPGLVN